MNTTKQDRSSNGWWSEIDAAAGWRIATCEGAPRGRVSRFQWAGRTETGWIVDRGHVVRVRDRVWFAWTKWAERYFRTGSYELTESVLIDERHTQNDLKLAQQMLGPNPGGLGFDLGAGSGRHLVAMRLALPGVEVVGIEPSPLARDEARLRASVAGLRGIDILDASEQTFASLEGRCDWGTLWFNPLGYLYSHDADVQLLQNARRLLRPGGRLLVDIRDGAYQRSAFATPQHTSSIVSVPGGSAMLETTKWCPEGLLVAWEELVVEGRRVHAAPFGWLTRDASQLRKLFRAAGYVDVQVMQTSYADPRLDVAVSDRLVATAVNPQK
jgi:SAM-dependent methyltransferase